MDECLQQQGFELVGGRLCLDFTNTISSNSEQREEQLLSYGDLVAWGRQAGALPPEEADVLVAEARRNPAEAEETLKSARRLRLALHRIFASAGRDEDPEQIDLNVLNAALTQAMARARIQLIGGTYHWAWEPGSRSLDRVLWPVARSAADLLVSDELPRVRECAGDTCEWLFLDISKNHSRHWCDMKSCGNRAKARRHYVRTRQAG